MNWAQLMRNPRGTGRVYTRAEIRKLEQAAYERGLNKHEEQYAPERLPDGSVIQMMTEKERREEAEQLLEEAREYIGTLSQELEKGREEGYLKALEQSIKAVEATPSSTGRKQILAMLNEQLTARKGGQ